MENTRYHGGEEKNDAGFAKMLGGLGDIFVNDAFSAAHRAHSSTEGIAHVIPAYAGRAMEAELKALQAALEKPTRPLAAVWVAPRSRPSSNSSATSRASPTPS